MVKPTKRWQLLLVADDGRMIPIRRIKGVAVTLLVLLVLLVLLCAGLVWQLSAEKNSHSQTQRRLAETDRQVADFKNRHEWVAAELVLARSQLEKAGLLPSQPVKAPAQPKDQQPLSAERSVPAPTDADEVPAEPAVTAALTTQAQPSAPSVQPAEALATEEPDPGVTSDESPEEAGPSSIELANWELRHHAEKQILVARFRVKNLGSRSEPIAGRCVVVLKNDANDPGAWLAMPEVALVDGQPDGQRGQAFSIVNFRDMEIKSIGHPDPAVFTTARIYVFDAAGDPIMAADFPVDLPAPGSQPASGLPFNRPATQMSGGGR